MNSQDMTFSRYDTADYLQTEEDSVAYLEATLEDGDPAMIALALGNIARARNNQPAGKGCSYESRGHL